MKPILFGLVLSLALLGCGKEKEPTAKSSVPEKSPAATATDVPLCPKCGIPMVQRTAKRGPNVGQSFFGCPNYPKYNAVA